MIDSSFPSQGTPMDVTDHSAHNIPTATQHYAGDVLPFPSSLSKIDFARLTAPESDEVSKTMGRYKQPLGSSKVVPLKPEFK